MKKFCVFCGQPPENKNMEHVIPQWLSKYANRYREICYQGSVTDSKIPFCNLMFPACTKCNDKFGKLESATKPILLSIMESKPVTGEQISLLLDWFDKIRVGIWLSELILAKKIDQINPGFHIADRIGKKDRILIIEHIKGNSTGLAYSGTGSQLFYNAPIAFQLIINNFVFTNASEYGLVSGRMGFPYTSKIPIGNGFGPVQATLYPGRNKTSSPVIMKQQSTPFKTLIYQPMYREHCSNPIYNNDYVQKHSYDTSNGTGGIFYQRTNNQIKYLGDTEYANMTPKPQPKENLDTIISKIYELQNHMLNNLYTTKNTPDDITKYIQATMLKNEILANYKNK